MSKTMKRAAALLSATAVAVVVPFQGARAAWDSTQPPTGGAVTSAPVRGNFVALESGQLAHNLLHNGELYEWSAGASAAPDGFTLAGAGGTIARTGAGEADTFTFGAGTYAAKITRSGTNVTFTWTVISTTEMASYTRARGQRFQAAALGKTSTASHLRITISDGVGSTSSDYHTGGGAAEWLVPDNVAGAGGTKGHVLDAAATKLEIVAEVNGTNAAAYVGGFVGFFSEVPPPDWSMKTDRGRFAQLRTDTAPKWKPGGATSYLAVPCSILHANATQVGNVGGGTDDLMTWPLPANTLNGTNKFIRVTMAGSIAGTDASRTVTVEFGSQQVLGAVAFTQDVSSGYTNWDAHFYAYYTGASTQVIFLKAQQSYGGSSWGGVGTFRSQFTNGTQNATGAITIKATGNSAAATNNDITQRLLQVELCETP